jgi:preprotein translocase subunit SecD
VNGEIGGGVFSITGPGDHESFERLYAVTKPGGFPVPVRIVQSEVRK